MADSNLRPADPDALQAAAELLESAGCTVILPSASDNRALRNRMGCLVSDLDLIEGLTRRGAVLPDEYRRVELPPIIRMATRIFDALNKGESVRHPWQVR